MSAKEGDKLENHTSESRIVTEMLDSPQNSISVGKLENTDGTHTELLEKVDRHGYPLQPQPSDDPLDPLNWKPKFKQAVLLQVSLLRLVNFLASATHNPTYPLIAKAFNVSVTQASWTTTITILANAVAPLAWAPLSNIYGRRPIYIYVTIIAIVAMAGSALATDWRCLLVARFFVGFGASTANGIGGSVIADLYFQHERGFYMGIYVVIVGNGAHIASLVGGPVGEYLGFRWCFWLAAIIQGSAWLMTLFCLPETLYRRDRITGESREKTSGSVLRLFGILGVSRQRNLKLTDFTHCFVMLKYPPVFLSILYFSVGLGIGSVLFAVTGAAAFGGIYGFDVLHIGLAIGLPTLIGTVLGELLAGRLSDYFLLLYRKRTGLVVEETRLYCSIPGAILLPVGVIIEGVTLQYRTHWIGPCFGMAIGSLGYQIISANIFGYLTDCYRPEAAEISSVLNFGRLSFSFTLGFYIVPFAEETTWGVAFATMAIAHLATYTGIVLLMWRGRQWRQAFGPPNLNKEL